MKILAVLTFALFSLPLGLLGQTIVGNWTTQIPGQEEGTMIDVELTINEAGTYTVDFNMDGTVEINGAYELDGDQMTIWDTGGDENYVCTDVKGVYRFSVTDGDLTMSLVSDECPGRGGPEGGMQFRRM